MSLSSHISDSNSPVRQFFEENFSATRTASTTANAFVRNGNESCLVPPTTGTDHALVGTAIGYVIAALSKRDALDDCVAWAGFEHYLRVEGMQAMAKSRPRKVLIGLRDQTFAEIRDLEPWKGSLSKSKLLLLCERCLILSRFEQLFRTQRNATAFFYILENHMWDPIAEFEGDLTSLSHGMASEPTHEDLFGLAQSSSKDCKYIRKAKNVHFGAKFAQSVSLGGADADAVVNGVLIDFKSSAKQSPISRTELWQLLGYLLADTEDEFAIDRVAISALRWRREVIWSATEFLGLMSRDARTDLQELRSELSHLLDGLPEAGASKIDARQ